MGCISFVAHGCVSLSDVKASDMGSESDREGKGHVLLRTFINEGRRKELRSHVRDGSSIHMLRGQKGMLLRACDAKVGNFRTPTPVQ